eukprot:GHVS01004980.1.p1 GENE.GHVS01004980.1~~GHVS01004980.1.p1  ORF type:complete len:1134 (+),score=193.16 GHVS01004980.1:229-3402(+)
MEESMIRSDLTPRMCRVRDLTYSAPVLVDVDYYRHQHIVRKRNVEIGRLPVMLRSCICVLNKKTEKQMVALGECPLDPGGYFVVKGTEKVILMQEQLSKNRIIVEFDFKHNISASVTSASAEVKSRTGVVHKAGKLFMRHNCFVDDVALCVVLRALGMESDMEVVQSVGHEHGESLTMSLGEVYEQDIYTQRAGLHWLAKKMRPRGFGEPSSRGGGIGETVDVLSRVVLSHIVLEGEGESVYKILRMKAVYLCLMARRVLDTVKDPRLVDDKDYYGNKRLELGGQLIALLFEDLFKRFAGQTKKMAEQLIAKYQLQTANKAKSDSAVYPDCFHNPTTDILTRGFQSAISTGNWTIKRFRMDRSGVTQVLNRLSYIACLGMMTRINSQFEKGRKVSGPRALQPSQWGMLCPCDTPEGESCGLVKNLALMTHVTTDHENSAVARLAFTLGVEEAGSVTGEELHDDGTFLVFLNGVLLGVHRRPSQFMNGLRELRRCGVIGQFASVYDHRAHKTIYVAADGGRLCRPLIIVEDGQSRLRDEHLERLKNGELSFMDLMRMGVVEWIDVNEENNLLIALRDHEIQKQTTHMEIDPLTLLGIVAGLIPYPNHNQSPRNTYQCAMGKQAMGAIATNQFMRTDTLLYLLVYPQRPLCKTRTIELVGFENLPAGHNASVAVMSYSGYDIEDAIVMNRASIDRGFGRCFAIRRYTVDMRRYPNGAKDTCVPPPPLESRRHQAIEKDGLAFIGARLTEDSIYVNRYSPQSVGEHSTAADVADMSKFRPTPAKYKNPNPAYVDRILCTENDEGMRIYKVLLRQTRLPELGDKFSSRHGQKGVVGLIVNQEDMPFSESGWCPDLIMNPHGFPSRMTVGKMMELLAGKSAVIDGFFKYGTAFGGTPVSQVGRVLVAGGFHYSGKEYLTSGITGEALESYVFVGPIYYQKLKHMVQDKIHARGLGPRQLLTRQPTEGRAKEGGLRLGEMERDCLVAYGTANLLMERLLYSSDVFTCAVCHTCGYIGNKQGWCTYCHKSDSMVLLKMPYACKLLFQELQAMNVSPKLILKENM